MKCFWKWQYIGGDFSNRGFFVRTVLYHLRNWSIAASADSRVAEEKKNLPWQSFRYACSGIFGDHIGYYRDGTDRKLYNGGHDRRMDVGLRTICL